MNEFVSETESRAGSSRPPEQALRVCIQQITQGNEQALSQIYDSTSSLVYGIAIRILGDKADAEEVALDVYSQIWRGASGFRPERGTVLGWVTVMARTRAIDRLRSRKRRPEEELAAPVNDKPAATPSPEQSTIEKQQSLLVRTALASLPQNQRELLELSCYSGFTHSELAQKLNLPLGTVKTRLRMGVSRLRELLAASPGESAQ